MGYYDAYNAILSVTKSTPRDSIIDLTQRAMMSGFTKNPSYYQVQITTSSTPLASTPVDTWIVDDSKTKELKQIELYPGKVLNYGDLVLWNGDYWLTSLVDNMGGIYYRGSILKCLSTIKWLDSGVIKTAPFGLTIDVLRSLGLQEGKMMFLPNERRYISIQNNVDTLRISKDHRFIFDNNRAWRVTSIDTLHTGLVNLELEENDVDPARDRLDLRIADYTQNPTPSGGALW